MPRRRRGLLDHSCYHVTHRCHKREFLFRFARDRQRYVQLLRQTVGQYRVDVLNYSVTANHVHLLVFVRDSSQLPRAMQYLQGEFGQYYNMRKEREGAFWRDRYHSTLIQIGEHLARCLFYIDLNMVRAGVVEHPREWVHGGHHELAGTRQRYRILNIKRLIRCLGRAELDVEQFRDWYNQTLTEKLVASYHSREAYWSEAFAVGDLEWLQQVYDQFGFKRKRILPAQLRRADVHDVLSESPVSYFIPNSRRRIDS